MVTGTASELLAHIAGGAQVAVRDEEWLVRSVQQTPSDGLMVRCIGTSSLVRNTEATFFTNLDAVEPLRPEETRLVSDDSPNYRRSRLYLEAVMRKTPVPSTDTDLAVAGRQLLDPLEYQRRAVRKALGNLQPRVLIADAVGLGKTLEVGLLLSELIRRGRGERILVVTPRHILEQRPARTLDSVRHPARPARLRRHPTGSAQDPREPEPLHVLPAGNHLHRHAEERRPIPAPFGGHSLGRCRHRRMP